MSSAESSIECEAEHGCSPIELLDRSGFLGPLASVIHGVHVTDDDIARLARTDTTVASCPTTEGNLGDGYLPAMRYADAGVKLAIGSDSQVRIDPFEEARELESCSRRERKLRAGLLAAHRRSVGRAVPQWPPQPRRRAGSSRADRP